MRMLQRSCTRCIRVTLIIVPLLLPTIRCRTRSRHRLDNTCSLFIMVLLFMSIQHIRLLVPALLAHRSGRCRVCDIDIHRCPCGRLCMRRRRVARMTACAADGVPDLLRYCCCYRCAAHMQRACRSRNRRGRWWRRRGGGQGRHIARTTAPPWPVHTFRRHRRLQRVRDRHLISALSLLLFLRQFHAFNLTICTGIRYSNVTPAAVRLLLAGALTSRHHLLVMRLHLWQGTVQNRQRQSSNLTFSVDPEQRRVRHNTLTELSHGVVIHRRLQGAQSDESAGGKGSRSIRTNPESSSPPRISAGRCGAMRQRLTVALERMRPSLSWCSLVSAGTAV